VRDLPVLREVFGPAARYAADPVTLAAELGHALTEDSSRAPVRGRELAARHTWPAAAASHLAFNRSLG